VRIILFLVVLNLLGAGVLTGVVCFARLRLDSRGVVQITELDRSGIIDNLKLAERFPDFVANTRYSLAHWITDPAHRFIILIAIISGVLIALNVSLLAIHASHIHKVSKPRA